MTLVRRITLVAVVVAVMCAQAAQAAQAPPSPRMQFDNQLIVRTACFSVVNPQGTRSVLYGQRFTDGTISTASPTIVLVHGIASSTENWDFSHTWSVAPDAVRPPAHRQDGLLLGRQPAGHYSVLYGQRFTDGTISTASPTIVLVHGIASSTENWDFSHTWSVARALASAGYVVVSYDQLGFAKSAYTAGSGGTLTTAVQRQLLHQVVQQAKAGSYTQTTGSNCEKPSDSHPLRSDKVVVVGHSAGGLVVAGYPGQYHDVAAMIQADISASKPTTPAPGGGFDPQPGHVDYFQFFHSRQDCKTFNAFAPGVVKYVLNIACAPPFVLTPVGEITGLGQAYADDATYIPKIGSRIPVLLTSGAQDTTDPPAAARQDFSYYRSHCHCSVARYTLANTGHLFMAHKSLPAWVQHVVTWLSAHDVKPTVVLPKDIRDEARTPRGLAVKVTPKQLRKFPLHFAVNGSVQLWSGMSPAQWCGGFVNVEVGATTAKPTTARTRVHRDCSFTEGIHVSGQPQTGKAKFLRLRFRFLGNDALQKSTAKTFLYRLPGT